MAAAPEMSTPVSTVQHVRSFELSDEVWQRLQADAEPFVDTVDSVLRRMLNLPPTPPRYPPIDGETSPAVVGGPPVCTGEYRAPVLTYLQQEGGTADRRDVLDAVHAVLGHRFREHDYSEVRPSNPLWENRIDGVVNRLRSNGLMLPATLPGVWSLTEEGMACDPETGGLRKRKLLSGSPRIQPGAGLSQRELLDPVMLSLQRLGGVATPQQLFDAVRPLVADRLVPADLEQPRPGRRCARWEERCRDLRSALIDAGLLSGSSRRGLWELTDEGMRYEPEQQPTEQPTDAAPTAAAEHTT